VSKRTIVPVEDLSADTKRFFDILNESSDLSVVLVATSYLDASLASMLHRYFIVSSVSDGLLDLHGSLGTISSRASLSYAPGLIGKSLYQALVKIIEIRNTFAHHHLEHDFEVSEIANLCSELRFMESLRGDADTPLDFEQHMQTSRDRFVLTAVMISQRLLLTALGVKRVPERSGTHDGWRRIVGRYSCSRIKLRESP